MIYVIFRSVYGDCGQLHDEPVVATDDPVHAEELKKFIEEESARYYENRRRFSERLGEWTKDHPGTAWMGAETLEARTAQLTSWHASLLAEMNRVDEELKVGPNYETYEYVEVEDGATRQFTVGENDLPTFSVVPIQLES